VSRIERKVFSTIICDRGMEAAGLASINLLRSSYVPRAMQATKEKGKRIS
jgi:hypothetical protein